jgi:SAM-dependent methyltransferase
MHTKATKAKIQKKRWDACLFENTKEIIRNNERLVEDERSADWLYLLPLTRMWRCLVVGSGWGSVPAALSQRSKHVHVVEENLEKSSLLKYRQRQKPITNLDCCTVSNLKSLPFENESFDLIVLSSSFSKTTFSLKEVLDRFNPLLKKGGTLVFSLNNRFSFRRLFSKEPHDKTAVIDSLAGVHEILVKSRFSNIRPYAPLPHINEIPLFTIPLSEREPFDFFLRHTFSLFDAVSPEVKKQYSLEYFVPGYMIIAEKEDR